MSFSFYNIFQKFVLSLFCLLSCAGIISGLLISVVQSPENQSAAYIVLADQYKERAYSTSYDEAVFLLEHSEKLTLKAISYDPYNSKIWENLKNIKEEKKTISMLNKDQDFALSKIR